MKKRYKILLVILVIIVVVGIYILSPKYSVTNKEKNRIKKEILDNISSLSSNDISFDEYKDIVDTDIYNVSVPVGNDSYLKNKPTEKIISKYKLQELVNLQEELSNKVEKRYLDNLEYRVTATYSDGDYVYERVQIVTYYYALYLHDYLDLVNALYDNKDNPFSSEEGAYKYYKALVIALQVLDKHLDDYDNKDRDHVNYEMKYYRGKPDSDSMYSLAMALQGYTYPNMDFSVNENVLKASERVKKYLEEAKEYM